MSEESDGIDPKRLAMAQRMARGPVPDASDRLALARPLLAETSFEGMPFPDRDAMPIDPPTVPKRMRWNARRWEAWCLLHEGHTTDSCAATMNLNRDTISNYRMMWKERFGVPITAKSVHEVSLDPRYKRPAGQGTKTDEVHEEFDEVALSARAVTVKWLAQFLGDQGSTRVANLTPAEVKAIQDIGLTAQKASLELQGATAAPAGAKPTTPAGKAVQGLSRPPAKRGPRGQAAEEASGVVHDLRAKLTAFRDAGAST